MSNSTGPYSGDQHLGGSGRRRDRPLEGCGSADCHGLGRGPARSLRGESVRGLAVFAFVGGADGQGDCLPGGLRRRHRERRRRSARGYEKACLSGSFAAGGDVGSVRRRCRQKGRRDRRTDHHRSVGCRSSSSGVWVRTASTTCAAVGLTAAHRVRPPSGIVTVGTVSLPSAIARERIQLRSVMRVTHSRSGSRIGRSGGLDRQCGGAEDAPAGLDGSEGDERGRAQARSRVTESGWELRSPDLDRRVTVGPPVMIPDAQAGAGRTISAAVGWKR